MDLRPGQVYGWFDRQFHHMPGRYMPAISQDTHWQVCCLKCACGPSWPLGVYLESLNTQTNAPARPKSRPVGVKVLDGYVRFPSIKSAPCQFLGHTTPHCRGQLESMPTEPVADPIALKLRGTNDGVEILFTHCVHGRETNNLACLGKCRQAVKDGRQELALEVRVQVDIVIVGVYLFCFIFAGKRTNDELVVLHAGHEVDPRVTVCHKWKAAEFPFNVLVGHLDPHRGDRERHLYPRLLCQLIAPRPRTIDDSTGRNPTTTHEGHASRF
mmetsp:Transcript_12036/g.21870  ORF Transcript_12036/g.21870 Transcript_12036/m.21870 type:complete len:270 (-) Transcript_12036:33-842(-)